MNTEKGTLQNNATLDDRNHTSYPDLLLYTNHISKISLREKAVFIFTADTRKQKEATSKQTLQLKQCKTEEEKKSKQYTFSLPDFLIRI